MFEIFSVNLRDGVVDEFAALFAVADDELVIVGGDHNDGHHAYVVAHFFVRNIVDAEVFFLSDGEFADYFAVFVFDGSLCFEAHEICTESYVLLIGGVEIAFGERDVVDGIEDIGLAHAIAADEAIHFFRKSKVLSFVVFEIGEMNGSEKQVKMN